MYPRVSEVLIFFRVSRVKGSYANILFIFFVEIFLSSNTCFESETVRVGKKKGIGFENKFYPMLPLLVYLLMCMNSRFNNTYY